MPYFLLTRQYTTPGFCEEHGQIYARGEPELALVLVSTFPPP